MLLWLRRCLEQLVQSVWSVDWQQEQLVVVSESHTFSVDSLLTWMICAPVGDGLAYVVRQIVQGKIACCAYQMTIVLCDSSSTVVRGTTQDILLDLVAPLLASSVLLACLKCFLQPFLFSVAQDHSSCLGIVCFQGGSGMASGTLAAVSLGVKGVITFGDGTKENCPGHHWVQICFLF